MEGWNRGGVKASGSPGYHSAGAGMAEGLWTARISLQNLTSGRVVPISLIPSPDSHGFALHRAHALHAPIPRRAACQAFGLRSRGQARQAEEGGAGGEGAIAVPAGKDAVLLRQRPEGLLPRLLLGQARRHHQLHDGDRRPAVRGGRGAARQYGGAAPPRRAARSGAGLPLPAVTPDAARQEQRRRSLHDVMDLAAKFFAETLASRVGAKARGYLADRAISPAPQLQFRLGYAPPDRFALKEHLGKLGVSVDDMVETGMLVAGNDIPVPYDRFRARVMFPITDLRGRVIAYGGRALEKDVPAKYLNSPETPLFHKGDNLYNHQTARKATHDGSPLIVVEGYVDVIAMVTAGFGGAVAPLGTALTENQLALLWKMADEPILCFDGDRAGQKAAYRAADLALPALLPGKSLRFALLPEGQDPDDLARSGGRVAIEEVISDARPLVDMLWSREVEGGSFATPERRAALEARINELSKGIRDEVVRRHYRDDLADRLQRAFAPQGGGYGGVNFRTGRGESPRAFAPRSRFSQGQAGRFAP